MNLLRSLAMTCALAGLASCSDESTDTKKASEQAPPGAAAPEPEGKRVLDLSDVKGQPDTHDWFDFRPNIQKLILAGAAETEHIAILWYTVSDGGVALHYHSKTESVYVIDGAQTDGKASYPTGTVYFNPPGSGHEVKDSSGFFLLAYAAPPDFMSTDKIEEYTPIRIDTEAGDLTEAFPFEEKQSGVRSFTPELHSEGGLSAAFIETTASKPYAYTGNYLLVLAGACTIDGARHPEDTLVVTEDVTPKKFELQAADDGTCLALGVSF
jgi:hypothetical protein